MVSDMELFEFGPSKATKVRAQVIGSKVWLHYDGQVFCRGLQNQTRGRRQIQGKGADVVLAPMPGKITKILVSPGSRVRPGDSLIMMEAMKMEYTLKAEVEGTIEAVDALEGAQVTLGKRLVKISSHKTQSEG